MLCDKGITDTSLSGVMHPVLSMCPHNGCDAFEPARDEFCIPYLEAKCHRGLCCCRKHNPWVHSNGQGGVRFLSNVTPCPVEDLSLWDAKWFDLWASFGIVPWVVREMWP